jgi:hypothetical protein
VADLIDVVAGFEEHIMARTKSCGVKLMDDPIKDLLNSIDRNIDRLHAPMDNDLMRRAEASYPGKPRAAWKSTIGSWTRSCNILGGACFVGCWGWGLREKAASVGGRRLWSLRRRRHWQFSSPAFH